MCQIDSKCQDLTVLVKNNKVIFVRRRVEQLAARKAHNLEVDGPSPSPAKKPHS